MDKLSDGLITYYMSPEEIEERYGPPGLMAEEVSDGDAATNDYLIEKSIKLKEAARRMRRR